MCHPPAPFKGGNRCKSLPLKGVPVGRGMKRWMFALVFIKTLL